MAFELPPLPYAEDALEPDYSARTISFHYGKHHKTYVETLNKLVAGTDLEGKSLEDVIMAVAGKPDKQPVFNNAAQVWNHTFFWNEHEARRRRPADRRARREDRRRLRRVGQGAGRLQQPQVRRGLQGRRGRPLRHRAGSGS